MDKKGTSLSVPQQTPVLGPLSKPQQQSQDLHQVDRASGASEADTRILQLEPDSLTVGLRTNRPSLLLPGRGGSWGLSPTIPENTHSCRG